MYQANRSALSLVVAVAVLLAFAASASTAAQEVPPPQPSPLECATGISVQLLSATPVGDGSQTLILIRGIVEPGGRNEAHRNLATVTLVVESGSFGFTLLDDAEMTVTRAATADAEATEDSVVVGEEVALNPGDSWAPPPGTTHAGRNLGDGETTVLIAALAETGQPLEACVEDATPEA